MKILKIQVFLIILFMAGCDVDDFSPYSYSKEATIYSEENSTNFRELLVVLKPYLIVENQKKYILTDSLRNILLKVNRTLWGEFDSYTIDTTLYENERAGNYKVTENSVKYSFVAPYQSSEETKTTAGEYSDLLNNYFSLDPGYYICEIESFEIKDENGDLKKIKTSITEPFEVKENSRSAFVGEFEILIK